MKAPHLKAVCDNSVVQNTSSINALDRARKVIDKGGVMGRGRGENGEEKELELTVGMSTARGNASACSSGHGSDVALPKDATLPAENMKGEAKDGRRIMMLICKPPETATVNMLEAFGEINIHID
jgi:hypothetical protein